MAAMDRSKLDEVLYWSSIVALTDNGSARALDARKKYQQANVALNREQHEELTRAIGQFSKEYMTSFNEDSGLSGSDSKKLDRSGGDASDYIASLRASIDLTKQSSDAMAENAIQMALATGQMTKLGAARAMAALHQQEYVDGLKELKDQAEVIKNDPTLTDLGRKAAMQTNANQTRDYQVQGGMQAQRDQVSVMSADPLAQFVLASRDLTGQLKEASVGLLNGINGKIINAASGQKTGRCRGAISRYWRKESRFTPRSNTKHCVRHGRCGAPMQRRSGGGLCNMAHRQSSPPSLCRTSIRSSR